MTGLVSIAVLATALCHEPPPRARTATPPMKVVPPSGKRAPPPARKLAPTRRPVGAKPTPKGRVGSLPATGPRVAAPVSAAPASKAPPEICKKSTDRAVAVIRAAAKVLAAEEAKKEDASVDRGLKALRALMAERGPEVTAARKEAAKAHPGLTEPQRKACERYAFLQFKHALRSLSNMKDGFASNRVVVFRLFGDLFR